MKTAKKLEAKKQKESDRKKEEKDKKVNHAINIWEKDIIPHWKSKLHDKKTIMLWNQGIPPRCRRKIWTKKIGNDLNISKGTFAECVRRVPPSLRASSSTSASKSHSKRRPANSDNNMSDNIANDASLYSYRRHRRTSSLDVLRENNEEHIGVLGTEEDEDQFKEVTLSEQPHAYNHNFDPYPNSFAKTGSLDNGRSAIDLESTESHDNNGDISLEDDDDDDDDSSSQEEDNDETHNDDKILKDPTVIGFLNKAIDEDILRTLPSLCVFQVYFPKKTIQYSNLFK